MHLECSIPFWGLTNRLDGFGIVGVYFVGVHYAMQEGRELLGANSCCASDIGVKGVVVW